MTPTVDLAGIQNKTFSLNGIKGDTLIVAYDCFISVEQDKALIEMFDSLGIDNVKILGGGPTLSVLNTRGE